MEYKSAGDKTASAHVLTGGGRLRILEADAPKGVIVICTGGGFNILAAREAEPVANAFAAYGWGGALLDYSLYTGEPLGELPVRQLGEAVAITKEEFPGKPVAVCGFSAGGVVACGLCVHYARLGLPRPDALILGYSVLTSGKYAHEGTILRLAGGGDRSPFCMEDHVKPDMPPAFIWHTVSDPVVPVQNSLLLARAMADAGVPFELHLFQDGPHSMSIATEEVADSVHVASPHIAKWVGLCAEWLDALEL